MASSSSQDARYQQLQRQAAEWGVGSFPALSLLPRPISSPLSPRLRTANDDALAEELLKRRRLNASQDNAQSGLRRAFTTNKKKSWDPKEIYDALDAHVGNSGSPGIAEALVFKLISTGASLSAPNIKNRTNLLTRRRSMETMNPSRILQKAVENRQTDMVTVLVQHADHFALDSALPIAIRSGDITIVELLLQYGANASQTADGQDAFRQICITGGQSDLVGLILQSDGRPSRSWLSECMIDATRKGCLDTVLRLSRSTADGNHRDAAALKEAVAQCRVDIALAILTGSKPPTGRGLDEAFAKLFANRSILPPEKMALTQALLCAGASGDVVSAALIQACDVEFYEMVDLLVTYGASVEYQDAMVLRKAISKGKSALAGLLLTEKTSLSRTYASECVECIPRNIPTEDRHALLTTLLRKGAAGSAIDDELIFAVQAGDVESTRLLLTPHFPGGRQVGGHSPSSSPRGMVYDRHETASVDHRGGEALRIAVISSNVPMVKQLLQGKPSPETLARVFSQIRDLAPLDKYHMAELFLATGLTGPSVSSALQEAIEEMPPQRDERFISLLLNYNADVNFNDGAGILSAISHEDVPLLERLLKNRPTPQTAAAGILKAMAISDRSTRYRVVGLLIGVGLGRESIKEVSQAMIYVLQTKPVDSMLLKLLLEHGKADVNFKDGSAVIHAARDPDPAILEHVLLKGNASPETLVHGLDAVSELSTTPSKAAKMKSMLRRTFNKDSLNAALVKEVRIVVEIPLEPRELGIIQSLLAAGADVNAQQATALRTAVSAADAPVSDLLFSTRPDPASLAAALPHALKISDLMDRLAFTKKLVEAGAPESEANRALVHAVNTYPDDISLVRVLASRADLSDGEALASAIRQERVDIVEVLLVGGRTRYTPESLNALFVGPAMKVVDRNKRVQICTLLLQAGVSGPAVSDALLAAAADGDTALGAALLQKGGASVDHRDGKAVLEACRAGAVDVLAMLLKSPSEIKNKTLAHGFQAATQVGDLKKRAAVFRLLLKKGVTGEVVDAQLVSAARFGKDGQPLVKLLLEFGADVNYNNGEAVWTATRSAILGSLALMLGVAGFGARQKKPSRATIAKALKASWMLSRDPRYQVIEWAFAAGQPLTNEQVHTMLVKAVKNEPDLRLIKLLLAKGASPVTNGCESLIEATQTLLLDVLAVFLEGDISAKDLAWTLSQAFSTASVDAWLSDAGFEAAKMLLNKGARGDGVGTALSTAIDAYASDKDVIARRYVELLTSYDVDVDHNDGLMLQNAAKRADSDLIRQLVSRKPNSRTVSMAFPYIFRADLTEDELLVLIDMFAEYHNGEERLDAMFAHPECEPVLFQAISKYPRSVKVLQALLDAGFYHDQMTTGKIMPDDIEEEEQINLLLWALLQPQKKVSDSVIELLISRGAKVNFESRLSKTTPLMLAVQNRRKDLVRKIILAGAEVDVVDATGNTPLTMATRIGGDVGTTMMTNILAAEPSQNDGSLHNATRELNLRAVQVLADFGHELDFPSPIHGGRSALGELCLNAAHAGPLTASQEKQMEKVMAYLIDNGTDLSLQSDGKSLLILALSSSDPIPTTRSLLKVGMWKHINADFNNHTTSNHVYSPTQYLLRLVPQTSTSTALLSLLRANRAKDTYYALSGPQPPDATNPPPDILLAERARATRLQQQAAEEEDHLRQLARTKESATLQDQVFIRRAELEEAKARREMGLQRDRGALDNELFAAQLRRLKDEQSARLRYEGELAQVGARKVKLLGEAEVEVQGQKQRAALEWERQMGGERVGNAKQMAAVRVREREEVDEVDDKATKRTVKRIEAQRRLVEKQDQLAARFVAAGVSPRQIGYVDELD
ncbi:hypothetical protein CONLIGDRAFT_373175 [Coniochaeta ligniaria NRRL 30616]|uniref:Ankyrin n=1 Tax=Coniochaeta ligniaria NRRL 30616 TaxID=1408157 RepID=A0A1J7JF55_9PEZI|nr:hypothetical protein CONLIGDRAFT_373175 [Coniochaeta ligniaria NRRL 30616]